MADEERGKRRRRGRRRDREAEENRAEEGGADDLSQGDISADDVAPESEIPEIEAEEEPKKDAGTGKAGRRERTRATGGGGGDVSPMDFWRSGRKRSARERRAGAGPEEQGILQRISSLYLPPWVPVVGIIVLVFGVLGLLFITRSATGAPRIGEDHWHAPYTFYVCGEKQPPAPTWHGSGVHTHGDGIVHIHPFTQSEEGAGARLTRWFEYGGGKLDGDEIRMPGSSTTYKNGDECPDGSIGEVQVFVNGVKMDDYSRYLPKDGDRIRLVFGPPEEQVQLDDRIVIPEESATRQIEITVDQPDDEDESSTVFTPSTITIDSGQVVKLIVNNVDEVSHGLRISGIDREYGTNDDFVAVPEGSDPKTAELGDLLEPGGTGFVVIRFDQAGTFEFHDPTVITTTGTITVEETAPEETEAPAEEFDSELDVVMQDNAFEPADLTIDASTRVKINLENSGEFVHNMRIAGPDGEFETDDDILSDDILPGETGEFVVELEAGEYEFRDDFRAETMTGTITAQ